MKYLTAGLLLVFFGLTIYWAVNLPVMIPTLIVAWSMIWLQAKYECFQ